MTDESKYCKDCKHGINLGGYVCRSPDRIKPDLVTGEIHRISCEDERLPAEQFMQVICRHVVQPRKEDAVEIERLLKIILPYERCGPEGKHFTRKPAPKKKTKP